MIKPEPEEMDVNTILARRYGLPKMVYSVPSTIDAAIRFSLVKVLEIGECPPSEENLARLARKFKADYGIFDAEALLEEHTDKIPPEAEDSDAMLLFPGTILGFCGYRAIPAIYWEDRMKQFCRRAVWFDSAPSLSRGFLLVPGP